MLDFKFCSIIDRQKKELLLQFDDFVKFFKQQKSKRSTHKANMRVFKSMHVGRTQFLIVCDINP